MADRGAVLLAASRLCREHVDIGAGRVRQKPGL